MQEIDIEYIKIAGLDFVAGSLNQQLCVFDYRYRKQRELVDARIQNRLNARYVERSNPLNQEAALQVGQFLNADRRDFNLPLLTAGTEFQQQVWDLLLQIPYGETRNYGQLAAQIGEGKAVRAVGAANGANALAIIIPCHRVIAADGSISGYAGGVSTKQQLLKLETSMF